MGNLEFVVVAGSRCVVEIERVASQRFSRPVRKWPSFVAPNPVWQRTAGGFQMTLHTQFELPVAVEPRGIHDGAANGIGGGAPGTCGLDVRGSGAVTPL